MTIDTVFYDAKEIDRQVFDDSPACSAIAVWDYDGTPLLYEDITGDRP